MSEIKVLSYYYEEELKLKQSLSRLVYLFFQSNIFFLISTIGNTYNPSFLKSYKRKQKPKKKEKQKTKHHLVGLCSEVETIHLKAVHRPLLRSHDKKNWIHLTQKKFRTIKSTWSLPTSNAQSKFLIKFVT